MKLYKFVLIGIVFLILPACNLKDTFFQEDVKWKEEVTLHDGRIITVDIDTTLTRLKFPCHCRDEIDRVVRFFNPNSGSEVSWEVPDSLYPIMIDLYDDVFYTVSVIKGRSIESEWGCQDPPLVFFKRVNNSWQRMELDDLSESTRQANFISSYQSIKAGVIDDGIASTQEVKHELRGYRPLFYEITGKKINTSIDKCN